MVGEGCEGGVFGGWGEGGGGAEAGEPGGVAVLGVAPFVDFVGIVLVEKADLMRQGISIYIWL